MADLTFEEKHVLRLFVSGRSDNRIPRTGKEHVIMHSLEKKGLLESFPVVDAVAFRRTPLGVEIQLRDLR